MTGSASPPNEAAARRHADPSVSEVDLVIVGGPQQPGPTWENGSVTGCDATPASVSAAIAGASGDAVLVLASGIPVPDRSRVQEWLAGPADAWHGGVRLGLGAHHHALTRVKPTWMLTAPVDPEVAHSSPLLSLDAVLVRRDVLDQLGGPDGSFETLTGAGLELGVRWSLGGALVRYEPSLVPAGTRSVAPPSVSDEISAVTRHFGRTWGFWALAGRQVRSRVPLRRVPAAVRSVLHGATTPHARYDTPLPATGRVDRPVSVIVPTIDRYPYLTVLLEQLAAQTVLPHEVIVVDQTAAGRRRSDLSSVAPDLPLTVIHQEVPGQSTARNAALCVATGELVLFVDDDDEVPVDLIEQHLARLVDGIDAICGGVDDATAGPPPPGFRHRRASNVFPTNNSMLRRDALEGSGLFDPAFDGGPREDHDLGLRLHSSGATLVYDPAVMVYHHHAQSGGLRTHGTRRITRASSRRSFTQRNLPTPNDSFIDMRYFTDEQYRASVSLRILTALSRSGSPLERAARALVQIALLPDTLTRLRRSHDAARARLEALAPVPTLPSARASAR